MAVFRPYRAFFRSRSQAMPPQKSFVWTKNSSLFPQRLPIAISLFWKNCCFPAGITGLLFLCACSDPPPLKLTLEQREWVDTLYFRRIEGMSARMDSQCIEKQARLLKPFTDSILAVRREEEAALRAKYQQ
jgi:hypothetical protein